VDVGTCLVASSAASIRLPLAAARSHGDDASVSSIIEQRHE
jgi:hypothetical protein